MVTFLSVLLFVSMTVVLGILILGVTSFAAGGSFYEKYNHKLMQMRVLGQGVAIVCFVLLLLAKGN